MGTGTTSLRGYLERRLPNGELLTVADVAGACNVSAEKVRGWIDEGTVEAVDWGTPAKPLFRIFRPSVVAMLERRMKT